MVSAEVQARVKAEVDRCMTIARQHNPNRTFRDPVISYNLRGRHFAGLASGWEWTIKLNADYLNSPSNVEEMILETTPHEVAHLIAFHIWPGERTASGKRAIHGDGWKQVMSWFGKDPTRTHDMVLADHETSSRKREVVRHDWKCATCTKVYSVGPKVHAKQLRTSNYRCKCGGGLVMASTGLTATEAVKTQAVTINEMVSKLELCRRIYIKHTTLGRKEMIDLFVKGAGCTTAGASTYYQTLKKRYGG